MANKIDLVDLPLGDDVMLTFEFTKPDDSPFDLTGGSAIFAMKKYLWSLSAVVTKGTVAGGMTVVDAANGVVTLSINASDTVQLSPGPYAYSAKAYSNSGKKNTQIVGTMTWIDSPTRAL